MVMAALLRVYYELSRPKPKALKEVSAVAETLPVKETAKPKALSDLQ